ncbi:MAG: substrate-binding domain-containing protein [Bacteroidota bacterium]
MSIFLKTGYFEYTQRFIYAICLFICFGSCSSPKDSNNSDTRTEGTINISSDESFKPVIDSQIKVFEDKYPDAHIIVHYKPEAECFRDFAVDSIRMVIVTRKTTKQEENFLIDSMRVGPEQMIVARDAIAVVLNQEAKDSHFTVDEIRQILTGKFRENLIPVFDGLRATSTVRFIVDSILKGDTLSSKTVAGKTSEEVLEYVSKNPDAVGFLGVNWIGNPEDSTQLSFLTKVKIARLESADVPGAFVQPVPYMIYTLRYPLVRDLVYIMKEKHNGLAHGFASFLSGEKGQLIFKRAYLAPMQKDLRIRPVKLRDE